MKILIVEDNPLLRENLEFLLKKFQFVPESAANGKEAFDKLSMQKYDAMILDINMPIMDGKQLLQKLVEAKKQLPTIALTSDGMLQDKLEMFELWVDDYMTKPFEVEELVVRLRSILRRWEIKIDNQQIINDVKINFSKKKIFYKEEEILFSHKMYLIIEFLSKNIWYPQNKAKIMEYVWWEQEENLEMNSTTLESHIYAIRKKLWKDFIKTVKGIWYIIEE